MSAAAANADRELDRLIDRMCDQVASVEELAALGRRLAEDPAARGHYIASLELHARLAWQVNPGRPFSAEELHRYGNDESGMMKGESRSGPASADVHPSSFVRDPSDPPVPSPEPPIPPIIINVSPLPPAPLFSTLLSPGGWLFSYAAATVITGMAILGAWVYKVSVGGGMQGSPVPVVTANQPPSLPAKPERELVGQITGTADCRWADPQEVPSAAVPLGRKYELASGLVEIAYKTGAKVILQGPCRYEVDSACGGFLSLGKLTARVVSGQWSVVSEAKSQDHYPLATSHYPLFSVRTPTAVVTDLGTEFGVEVSPGGTTTSHVFRGSVRVRLAAGAGQQPGKSEVVLRTNQSARVERDAGAAAARFAPKGAVGDDPVFVRRLVEPPKVLDLLDIVAEGDGTGHRRERGIDPATGMQDPAFYAGGRFSDGQYHRVPWQKLIDGVFIPDGRRSPVVLDSAGHTFDGCPDTDGYAAGSISARAAEVKPHDARAEIPEYYIYALGHGRQFMPEGRGLLAFHANAGLTFDLEAMRRLHPGVRPVCFQAVAGLGDASRVFPQLVNAGDALADIWVFVDGRLKLKRTQLRPADGTLKVDVELGPGDRFLTLVSTDGGNGTHCDWVVFGDPVLQMISTEPEGSGDRSQPPRKEVRP